ncbi:MAG: 30S ribosomal protein S27e [Candidatus Diapherotrites archaeon]|nr:30S ribosomal protein S27e [Candidatus Diapherotrites archaeon]
MGKDSHFLLVVCPECGNKQRVFERSSTEVKCTKCNAVLVKPRGGKAEIKGKIAKVFD